MNQRLIALCLACASALAADRAEPLGAPVLDPPTLRSLGGSWIVRGDDDRDATVAVAYRKKNAASAEWSPALPFFRVEKDAEIAPGQLAAPDGAWLFAGSIVLLDPDTEYEIKLTLSDPDGGADERILTARTIAEPVVAADAPRRHVVPGDGGGSGSAQDPFRGLAAAQAAARPGDVMLLHAGDYGRSFAITASGEPGKPIVWRGAGDGEAVLGGASADAVADVVVLCEGRHDVWLERLTVAHAGWGFMGKDSARIVIRRCRFTDIRARGIGYNVNDDGATHDYFISDNVLEGGSGWPRPADNHYKDQIGIQGTGTGNEVCYNRISGFADGMDLFESARCYADDLHNNEISETHDDGCEMDGSQRNTRCYENRFTNCFMGISLAPIHGGPAYVFRNAVYNVCAEPFKLHNHPFGAVLIHNTSVKKGSATRVQAVPEVRACWARDNLYVGSDSDRPAADFDVPMRGCDFDHDGFGFGATAGFMKYDGARYASLGDAALPIERHAVRLDPRRVFASGAMPPADERARAPLSANDLRLADDSPAIDAGTRVPNFDDGFTGAAPDLGAYEHGVAAPQYGPRPETMP